MEEWQIAFMTLRNIKSELENIIYLCSKLILLGSLECFLMNSILALFFFLSKNIPSTHYKLIAHAIE